MSGARHSVQDMKVLASAYEKAGEIQKHMKELGHMEKIPLAEDMFKITPDIETLVMYGSEVKALGGGKVGGYLVRFSDEHSTDIAGDFFAPDTDFGEAKSSPILFHHGLDSTIGAKRLGSVEFKTDDTGIWVEGILAMRDKYEKAIYSLAQGGKLGWSSGTASHLVRRKKVGEAQKIEAWPLGLDASLTPTPAEPRNHAMELKSIEFNSGDWVKLFAADTPEDVPESTVSAGASVIEATIKTITKDTPMEQAEKDQLLKDAVDSLKAAQALEIKKAEDEKKAKETLDAQIKAAVIEAMKQAPAVNAGGLLGKPNLNLKTEKGDDAIKAFGHFLKAGDPGGIRTGEAYENHMKTTYPLVEATQYQGQEVVPTEVEAMVHVRRNQISIARAGNATVVNANSNAMVLPIEKNNPEKFVIAAENNTYDQLTQQPLDKLTATIYNFTKWVSFGNQLLEDSVADLTSWWAARMGFAQGITENYYLISIGTGSGQPGSALVGSTLGVTAASQTVVTAGEIVSLYGAVPSQYRDNVVWVMTTTKEGLIRALTASTSFPFTGTGGYAGGTGNFGSAPGNGWLVSPSSRVFNDDQMPASTTGLRTILCGNLNAGYAIVERKGMTIFRDPYGLATTGMTRFISTYRQGGGVIDATALYHLIQA